MSKLIDDYVNPDELRGLVANVDIVTATMELEGGDPDERQTLIYIQYLVASGAAWQLQGSYGRMASRALENNIVYSAEEFNKLPEPAACA